MDRRNWYKQLVNLLHYKLPTIGTDFPTQGSGLRPLTSEVGGECVTTVPPWALLIYF